MQPGFIKGNLQGLKAATLATITRPATLLAQGNAIITGDCANVIKFKADRHKLAQLIKDTYAKGGAPKSGAFLTQNVGDIVKKVFTYINKCIPDLSAQNIKKNSKKAVDAIKSIV